MNANPFIAEFDGLAHAAFADAGMASTGLYALPGEVTTVERAVFVNTGVQSLGEFNQVLAPRTVIGFLLSEGVVVKNATVLVAGRTYVLQKIDDADLDDGSLQWWVVRNG